MEALIIILILSVISLLILVVYRLFKWFKIKKKSLVWVLSFISIVTCLYYGYIHFFAKMEIIQSKAIPNLYLIKNPLENRDSLYKEIKKVINEHLGNELSNHKKVNTNDSLIFPQYKIEFYNYTKSFILNPFGEAGTSHFLTNKEDPGGFSSEELNMYYNCRIAHFDLTTIDNMTKQYFGKITFYNNGEVIKTVTISSKTSIN